MARSRLNMWIRDRIQSDERVPVHPKTLLRQYERDIARMQPGQRMNAVEYVRSQAIIHYVDRHKSPVPPEVNARLSRLETRAERAEIIDKARAFIDRYGPPEKALQHFMRAPAPERKSRREKQPEPERERPLRAHDIPWMMHRGPVETMSPETRASAEKSYAEWDYKHLHPFADYVAYTQRQWQQPDRASERIGQIGRNGKDREVEISHGR